MVATLPTLAFALVLALFVPKLDSLVGLLTSLCVPIAMLGGPALLLLLRAEGRPAPLLLVAVAVGLALAVAILAETVASIATTDYAAGDYWCTIIG